MTKRLLAKAIKKVYFEDKNFNKEFLIRRRFQDYASIEKQNIRFTIYELATSEGSDNKYGLLGKCLVSKTISYEITELSEKQVLDFMKKNTTERDYKDKKSFLNHFMKVLVKNYHGTSRDNFTKNVKEMYGVQL